MKELYIYAYHFRLFSTILLVALAHVRYTTNHVETSKRVRAKR